jgi:ribosomal protein S27AE
MEANMATFDFEQRWRELSEEVLSGMAEWRVQHPRATFQEIETALDERLDRLRARMLEDAALASATTDWRKGDETAKCPQCGQPLQAAGKHTRHLQTRGRQEVSLTREYGKCPTCGSGLFPPG